MDEQSTTSIRTAAFNTGGQTLFAVADREFDSFESSSQDESIRSKNKRLVLGQLVGFGVGAEESSKTAATQVNVKRKVLPEIRNLWSKP